MSLDRRAEDLAMPMSKKSEQADYFNTRSISPAPTATPEDDLDAYRVVSRDYASTATPMSPLSVASSSTWVGTGRESDLDSGSRFSTLKLPAFHITSVEDGVEDELTEITITPTDLQEPLPAHLEAPRPLVPEIKPIVDPRRPALRGLPTPKIEDEDRDEITEDYGAAAPVRALPPSVQLLPDGTECLPSVGKNANEPAPLVFPTTQLPVKNRIQDVDGTLTAHGRRNIKWQKHTMQVAQLSLNGFCIFATWWWTHYYYLLLPLITATVALNVIMVFSIVANRLWRAISPEKKLSVEIPESLVLLIPCYNETREELERSLDSLVAQQCIEHHKQAIMIICDGKVRGPGMEKTTADYLIEDILIHKTSRKYIRGAYTAWDQQPMDVVLQRGTYGGIPYICMIKQQNQGKRDGLIVARSFLYNFNRRTENPATVFTREFFNELAEFLLEDALIDNVVHLIGMDADTVFDKDCISTLLEESRYPGTVGVCGYVAVDWKDNNWNPWKLYQSAEYTIAQALRRLHQSTVTHKVSCLPGCCQLLKICEETCGDFVLLDLFGYCPDVTDGLLKQIRATASEDRNHVCHMLSARPQSQTRQALHARAFTDVPASWSVFLSQRRRWTLGATSNDLLLVFAPGVQWFERILAGVNVWTWFLNPFIIASLASFIFALTVVPVWIIMCFIGVMLIPIVYYICIPLWLCKSWTERFQFWTGCLMYIFCGPFINIAVLCYALWNMDSFGWGKTRKVIAEPETGSDVVDLEKGHVGASEQDHNERAVAAATKGSIIDPLQRRDIGDEEKNIGL